MGERTKNIFHIQDNTGVHVNLRGQQKDGTLEFILTGDADKLDQAAQMVGDLVDSVHADYNDWLSNRDEAPERHSSSNKDHEKDRDKGQGKKRGREEKLADGHVEEFIEIPTDGLDEQQLKNLRGDLVGEGGCNMKHIEGQAGCSVQVNKDGNIFKFILRGPPEAVEEATSLCNDLSESVFNRMEEADGDGDDRRGRPRGGQKGGGRDRRKRGGKGGDDRKRQRY